MNTNIFKYLFLVGLFVAGIIRSVYGRKYKQDRREDVAETLRKESPAVKFFMALWGIAQLLPIFYAFAPWFDFADYSLPLWTAWLGTFIFAVGLWMLWRSHADLALHWSPTLELREEHTLVTGGVFRYIRHPMYAAHVVYAIGQVLMLQNWLVGPGGLLAAIPLLLLRVGPEEEMMLEKFGDEYRAYMQRTGRFFPRFGG